MLKSLNDGSLNVKLELQYQIRRAGLSEEGVLVQLQKMGIERRNKDFLSNRKTQVILNKY